MLRRNILVGVHTADEGPRLAPEDAFDDLAELLLRRVLEIETKVAQALVIAQLAILFPAGVRLSSSVQTIKSGPAKSDLALVGPRPN